MAELSFEGRRVVITGAGRGLGKEYALLLAARGAKVAVVDLGSTTDGSGTEEASPAHEVVAQIEAAGGTAIAIRADVSKEADAQAIVGQAVAAFGGLDTVINNAGIVRTANWLEVPAEEYQRHLDVHYYGTLWLCRAAWPHLKESGAGAVLNTISAAMLSNPLMVHYGSSKGAVFGLTRNLALEGAADRIRVNAIAPGAGTRMGLAAGDSLTPEIMEFMRTQMKPELVAPAACFLVHPDCTVSGETFNVAAGMVNRMVVVNTAGVYDTEATIETIAARWDEVMALPDLGAAQPQLVPVAEPVA